MADTVAAVLDLVVRALIVVIALVVSAVIAVKTIRIRDAFDFVAHATIAVRRTAGNFIRASIAHALTGKRNRVSIVSTVVNLLALSVDFAVDTERGSLVIHTRTLLTGVLGAGIAIVTLFGVFTLRQTSVLVAPEFTVEICSRTHAVADAIVDEEIPIATNATNCCPTALIVLRTGDAIFQSGILTGTLYAQVCGTSVAVVAL
ncbi:hypothetical protein HQ571_04650 [Candidatus Kuenenbacteria bacterium]|nr:hypothetical protein [Candidatus Kuenenbacteria bacterium]